MQCMGTKYIYEPICPKISNITKFSNITKHKPCLHESSNPGSTHFRLRTEFQSTNGCGLSQPGLQSRLGAFTLVVNPG